MENLNESNQPALSPEADKLIIKNQEKVESDNIILMDYIKIILKRKIIIGSIVLIITVAAIIFNLLLPSTYEARALIYIGRYKNKPIETFNEITSIFNSDEYLKQIASALSLLEGSDYSTAKNFFTIEKDKGADFLMIKGRGKTPEIAVKNTNAIIGILFDRHDKLFSTAKKTFETEIILIKEDREKTLADIKALNEVIKRIEKDIIKYETKIQEKDNAQSEAQGRIVESYINLVASLKTEKEGILFEISKLNLALSLNDQALQQKEFEKQYETNQTKIEIAPIAPKAKIAPNRRRNVIAAFSLAVILGLLTAFAVEYFQKYKHKLKNA
ncbi:hypothetical protein HZB94_02755 [Candidatus Falkowbacteria bacterium]|nr:hypothetical protein [Candidatus Falkowbacteria bacterium]